MHKLIQGTKMPINIAYLCVLYLTVSFQILVQCLAALLLTIFGVVHIAGTFKEIRASADLDHK